MCFLVQHAPLSAGYKDSTFFAYLYEARIIHVVLRDVEGKNPLRDVRRGWRWGAARAKRLEAASAKYILGQTGRRQADAAARDGA